MGYLSIPAYGWLPPALSILRMLASALLRAYLGACLAIGHQESTWLATGKMGTCAYAAFNEVALPRLLLGALVSLVIEANSDLLRVPSNVCRDVMMPS